MNEQNKFTDDMALDALKWIIGDVSERQAEAERDKTDDFSKGRALAYWEVMDMIKSRLAALGVEIESTDNKKAV